MVKKDLRWIQRSVVADDMDYAISKEGMPIENIILLSYCDFANGAYPCIERN